MHSSSLRHYALPHLRKSLSSQSRMLQSATTASPSLKLTIFSCHVSFFICFKDAIPYIHRIYTYMLQNISHFKGETHTHKQTNKQKQKKHTKTNIKQNFKGSPYEPSQHPRPITCYIQIYINTPLSIIYIKCNTYTPLSIILIKVLHPF